MALQTMSDEDRAEIREVLLAQRHAGAECPMLPADVDLDGDGVADCFGLDDHDQVVILSGVPLEDSLYQATGETPDSIPSPAESEAG